MAAIFFLSWNSRFMVDILYLTPKLTMKNDADLRFWTEDYIFGFHQATSGPFSKQLLHLHLGIISESGNN